MIIEKNCLILENKRHTDTVYSIHLEAPEIVRQSKPGHFINVKVTNDGFDPLLRRPFSIYRQYEQEGTLEILYQVMGRGTEMLTHKKQGEILSVLGPLGNTFDIEGNYDTAFLVAGGIGIAPMPFLSDALEMIEKNIRVVVGFRTEKDIVPWRWLREYDADISTDDGSYGLHGYVTQLLDTILENSDEKIRIFGCGPTPMMANLHRVAERYNVECQLSIEENMACGMGLCKGCPVQVKTPERDVSYQLVCAVGPVFDSRKIVWEY